MPFCGIITCLVLLQVSYTSSTARISGLNSRDTFDSSTDFTEAGMDSISFLDDSTEFDPDLASPSSSIASADPIGIELDAEPIAGLGVTSLNSDDLLVAASFDPTGTEGYCSSQKRKRKRNDANCPIPKVPISLEIHEGDPDTPLDSEILSTTTDKKNPECEERIFGFGRSFDVCCNGPLGPYGIDYRARLIFNWIGDCRLGMPSMVSIRVILLIAFDWRGQAPMSYRRATQCLLSVLDGELYFGQSQWLTEM